MAPLAVDNEKFYIYASTAEKQQDPKLVINKDTTSDEFVAELLNKVIIVTKRPSEPAFDATFHQDDEWAKWLKVLNKDGKFSLTMAKDKAEIDHFELAFQDPIALKFSSTKSALINAFGDDAKDIRAPGYDSQELCAGLIKPNDSPDGEVELEKVWKFAGLLPTMLPTVLQNLKVGMDWSLPQKHRNALWFNPGFGSQLTIRLAMHLASVDTLNTLIHSDWLKMSITKAEVVAKKVVTAADTGKRKLAVNEGDALLGLGCKLNKDLELTGCAQFSDGLIKFTLQTDTTDAVAKIIAWLGDVIWGQDDKLKEMEKLLHTEPCESITFRRFQLTLDTSGSKPRVQSFRVDVQAATVIGQDPSKSNKTLFRISYTWSNMPGIDSLGTIRGQLWERKAFCSVNMVRILIFQQRQQIPLWPIQPTKNGQIFNPSQRAHLRHR